MTRSRQPRLLYPFFLAAFCASTISAMPAASIFRRADTCSADEVSCGSSLPSDFCCESGATCIALAGNTTAVCCPEGSDCSTIQPITCNVTQQDVNQHPGAKIKTTVFNIALEACGTNVCCPFGYSCVSGQCQMNKDQSEAPTSSETASSASAGPSATSTSPSSTQTEPATSTVALTPATSTASAESSTASSDTSQDSNSGSGSGSKSDNGPKKTSIIGGVIGGALVFLCIAAIVYLCIRRRNRRDGQNEKGSHGYGSRGSVTTTSTGSFGNIISEPIMQPNSYRTDFILKTPSSRSGSAPREFSPSPPRNYSLSPQSTLTQANSIQTQPPRIRISIPNPFDSPNPSPRRASSAPSTREDVPVRTGTVTARLPPIRAMKASSHASRRPGTPELQREPSSESINVFADPNTVDPNSGSPRPKANNRLTSATTFTELMDEADLGEVRRGRPYVPGTTPKI